MKHATQTPAAPTADDGREPAPAGAAGGALRRIVRRPGQRAPGKSAPGKSAAGQWTAWAFLAPVVIYLLAFYAYPLYRNVDLSLRNYTVRSFVQGDAPFTGLANYAKAVGDATFGPALWHTVVFTLVSLAFQFTIGLALAVFFTRHFRLSATLRALFLVPWLLPLIVSSSTWSWMLNSDSGVVNAVLHAFGIGPVNWLTSPDWSLWSVTIANIWIGIPFNLVVLYSGLQAIPSHIHEAAALDGASGWQRFWRVTFPPPRAGSAGPP
ncbi:carbohydrate ABC transporter permease, partial [Microbispora tritici]